MHGRCFLKLVHNSLYIQLFSSINCTVNLQLTDYEKNSLNKLGESIQNGQWSNEALVQLIELAGSFLNLQTIPDYCKSNGITYNGVKKSRNVQQIFNVKFVIDNV